LILLAKLLTKVVEMATLGWLNRVLGLVLSLFVTALVLGLLATVFDALNQRFQLVTESKVLSESVLYPILRDFADLVFPFLKQILAPVSEAAEELIATI
jgi:membrane protein required for colicin V production